MATTGTSTRKKVYLKSAAIAENVGWIIGCIIPVIIALTKIVLFYGNFSWGWSAAMIVLIAGGLAYSAPTVQNLIINMLPDSKGKLAFYKSVGFTVLLEGTLVATPLSVHVQFDTLMSLAAAKFTVFALIQYGIFLGALATLAGINGYAMSEMAINNLVKPDRTRTTAQKNKPAKTNLRLAS